MRRMISHTLALVACATVANAADDVRPQLNTELAPGPFVMSLNLEGLLEAASTSKPTSIWWDTETANNRAYITEQVKRAASNDRHMPPLFEVLEGGRGALLVGYNRPEGSTSRDPSFAMVADLGASTPAWKAWGDEVLSKGGPGNSSDKDNTGSIRGYTGYYEKPDAQHRAESAFVGFQENRVLAGITCCMENAGAGVDPASYSDAPLTMSVDITEIIKRIQAITELDDWDRYNYAQWAPFVAGMMPKAEINITPQPEGWESVVSVSGIGSYNVAPVGDAVLKTIPAGSMLWATNHIDLDTIVAQINTMAGDQEKSMIQMMTGADIPTLASWFTGDISLAVKPAMMIPEITFTIGLNNQEGALVLMSKFLTQFAQENPIDGADKGWMATVPDLPMPIYIAVGNGMVAASNNMMTLSNIIKGENIEDASAAAGKAGFLHMDLPVIAQSYLPLVWGRIASIKQPLGRSELDEVKWSLRNVYEGLQNLETIDKAAVDAAIKDMWGKKDLLALLGEDGDIADKMIASFSAWKVGTVDEENMGVSDEERAIFVRTQDGYVNIAAWDDDILTIEQAQAATKGFVKFSGPDLETLPIITVEAPPMIDANWFPSMDKVIQHMPVYQVSVESTGAGAVVLQEKGLPLISGILGGFGTFMWFDTAERYARALRNQAEVEEEKLEVKKAESPK